MTLYHRKVALIIDEIEDLLTSGKNRDRLFLLRGDRTNSNVETIIEKIEALKAEFPQLKSQLDAIQNNNKNNTTNNSDANSDSGSASGSAGGVIRLPATPRLQNQNSDSPSLNKKSLTLPNGASPKLPSPRSKPLPPNPPNASPSLPPPRTQPPSQPPPSTLPSRQNPAQPNNNVGTPPPLPSRILPSPPRDAEAVNGSPSATPSITTSNADDNLRETVFEEIDEVYELLPENENVNINNNNSNKKNNNNDNNNSNSNIKNNNKNNNNDNSNNNYNRRRLSQDSNYSATAENGQWANLPANIAMNAALYSGNLKKHRGKGGLSLQAFKPKFCVLRDGSLIVYDKATDKKPKEIIDLVGCQVKETSTDKFSFKVWGIMKDHEFNAENEGSKTKWMDKIMTMTKALNVPIEPDDSTDSGSEADASEEEDEEIRLSMDDQIDSTECEDARYFFAFVVKWDFKAIKPQQLTASRGDLVDLLNKDYDKFGWWTLQNNKGRVGILPKDWLIPAYEKIVME